MMTKEEFNIAFSLVESYMIKAPIEIENAYKVLKSDYVNQSKNVFYLQQRINEAIDYLKETTCDFGNDEMIFDKCNAYKLLLILRGGNND